MSEFREAVATGMRIQRAARRWSQRTLAERLGWSQAVVSAAELGNRGFDVDDLFLLAEVFDIPVTALFRDAPEPVRRRLGMRVERTDM